MELIELHEYTLEEVNKIKKQLMNKSYLENWL